MHVSELFELTHWIDSEIIGNQIVNKYQELFNVLNRNAQPNQQKQPFEAQKETLIKSINDVALKRLSIDQLAFLENLEIAQFVGDAGISHLEDILFKNVIDIATSAKKLQEIIQKINNGITKSNQIKSGLSGCVDIDTENVEDILIRISFLGHASMRNVSDLKKWGDIWFEIGRGIAMAHNASPEDIKIVGAKKGSIIIELGVAYGIAKTTSMIILEALKVADRVLDIKKKAEEIKGMKLSNNKLAREIEKEAEKEKKEGVERISKKIVSELGINENGEGDKVNALDKAVKDLVGFIEQGGEVDFIVPEDNEEGIEDEEEAKENQRMKYNELRTSFEEIRKMEGKLRLLESKNP